MADVNMYINIHVVHNTRMYRDVVYVPIFRFSYVSGGGEDFIEGERDRYYRHFSYTTRMLSVSSL